MARIITKNENCIIYIHNKDKVFYVPYGEHDIMVGGITATIGGYWAYLLVDGAMIYIDGYTGKRAFYKTQAEAAKAIGEAYEACIALEAIAKAANIAISMVIVAPATENNSNSNNNDTKGISRKAAAYRRIVKAMAVDDDINGEPKIDHYKVQRCGTDITVQAVLKNGKRFVKSAVFLCLMLFASCAPMKQDLSPIPSVQTFDITPSFEAKTAQHVCYLADKYKRGRAHAIAYIANYAHVARRIEREYGIPAEITLAAAMLESGYGGSQIAVCSRNHFGIKRGDGWRGATFVCQKGVEWRAYATVEEGYIGFGEFIAAEAPCFLAAPSVETFAQTGYAGGGRKAVVYAADLHSIIARYELKDLFTN